MAERYDGAETTVPDWHTRLVCAGCGSRQIDFVAINALVNGEVAPAAATQRAYRLALLDPDNHSVTIDVGELHRYDLR
jgi:hypothetical protein